MIIKLSLNSEAVLDRTDYERFSSFKWYALKKGNTFYAVRSKPRKRGEHRKKLHLHREILGLTEGDGKVVDHINGDGLDNRRENLRIVSPRENSQNKQANRDGKMVGTKKLPSGNFESRIWYKGKYRYLGVFPSELEAHTAYKVFSEKI